MRNHEGPGVEIHLVDLLVVCSHRQLKNISNLDISFILYYELQNRALLYIQSISTVITSSKHIKLSLSIISILNKKKHSNSISLLLHILYTAGKNLYIETGEVWLMLI